MQVWEYFRTTEAPDLEALGRDGWQLVAIRGEEWVFQRPEPGPEVRFTLDQRSAALAGAEAPAPVARHLLNPHVASLIRRVNHTQMLLLADRGFPVPPVAEVIDLSLTSDIPTIPQVLAAIVPDLPLDRLIAAEEQAVASPDRWAETRRSARRVEAVPHLELKRLAGRAVGCIRTGDSVPYANLLLVGG